MAVDVQALPWRDLPLSLRGSRLSHQLKNSGYDPSIEQIAEKYNVDLRFIERLSKSIDKG